MFFSFQGLKTVLSLHRDIYEVRLVLHPPSYKMVFHFIWLWFSPPTKYLKTRYRYANHTRNPPSYLQEDYNKDTSARWLNCFHALIKIKSAWKTVSSTKVWTHELLVILVFFFTSYFLTNKTIPTLVSPKPCIRHHETYLTLLFLYT